MSSAPGLGHPGRTHLLSLLQLLGRVRGPGAGPEARGPSLLQAAEESLCGLQLRLQLCKLGRSAQRVTASPPPPTGAQTPGSSQLVDKGQPGPAPGGPTQGPSHALTKAEAFASPTRAPASLLAPTTSPPGAQLQPRLGLWAWPSTPNCPGVAGRAGAPAPGGKLPRLTRSLTRTGHCSPECGRRAARGRRAGAPRWEGEWHLPNPVRPQPSHAPASR